MRAIHSPYGTMRSAFSKNSFFFVLTCDSSSLTADRLICLSIFLYYLFLSAFALCGIAASLFYEAKIAEAVSLVVEAQQKKHRVEKHLSSQDIAALENVTVYLNDHFAFDIPLERLAGIACMGTTKLKTTFKQFHNCTITEYVHQRRMGQAEHLLAKTDLTIGQVAQTVGYSTSSRFAELFRKSTVLLPGEYREISQKK